MGKAEIEGRGAGGFGWFLATTMAIAPQSLPLSPSTKNQISSTTSAITAIYFANTRLLNRDAMPTTRYGKIPIYWTHLLLKRCGHRYYFLAASEE
jgi:hypothetical protein